VAKASAEERTALSRLTSSDVRSVRKDVVALYIEDDRDRRARVDFDAQLLRLGRL
jgi:hypothetical protein